MTVDFGLALVERQPRGALDAWMNDLDQLLPQLQGRFKSLWMTDHLFWDDYFVFESWTALSFLAARWPGFDVGPMVMCQSYRNPALLAKMAATLQVFSGGRLLLGIGAGWKEDEYLGFGYPFPAPGIRIEQLEDTLEIVRRLWTTSGSITYQGKHYSVVNAYCEPKPDPLPPIIVGGGGDKTMKLAARYADWWNISDANFSVYRERVTTLRQHCEAIGRDPATLRLTWFGRIALGHTEADAVERGLSGSMKFTRANAFVGTPKQVVEQMLPYIELGADYFMVDVLDLNTPDIVGMLLDDVLPALQDGANR